MTWARTVVRPGLAALLLAGFAVGLIPALREAADSRTPMPARVSEAYIKHGAQETGAVNIVTAVLLDYRAFDTLGEATVIFAAAAIVATLLAAHGSFRPRPALSPLVRCAMDTLLPWFWIFPVAVILQGHLTPGGGFQGGVALAVLLILVDVVYGAPASAPGVGDRTLGLAEALGALALLFLGAAGLVTGAGFLANLAAGFPGGVPFTLASAGLIPLLNVAIGCKVAAALASIFRHLVQQPGAAE